MTDGNVTALRPCRRCGKPGRTVEMTYEDVPFAKVTICAGCFEASCRELASLRPVFDAMLVAGASRDVANRTMTFMLERMDEEAKRA